MRPDDELMLKEAFAELLRRQREQAPPFTLMRDEAIRRVQHRPAERSRATHLHRLAWAGAAVFIAALAMWRLRPDPEHSSPKLEHLNKMDRVNRLITAIEWHVENSAPHTLSDYPTDLLLPVNQADNLP